MPLPRPFALIQTEDQWLRASHLNTALDNGILELAWTRDQAGESAATRSPNLRDSPSIVRAVCITACRNRARWNGSCGPVEIRCSPLLRGPTP